MQNLKICFEGPSAAGKSTLARLFSTTHHIIQEVNELFPRPIRADKFWYLERQVERYQIAKRSPRPVVFDGDPFQPLWYNWIFPPTKDSVKTSELHTFYHQKILQNQIAFPDLYFVFYLDKDALIQRREKDASRQRRNFEKHLQLIEPQKRFFQYLHDFTELNIYFIDLEDLQAAYRLVSSIIRQTRSHSISQISNYQTITSWFNNKSPDSP